jgi:uncharacterized protein (TIGR02677 family)
VTSPEPSYTVFRHLDVELSPLYRRVLRAFVESKDRFQVHLRPEDVLAAMHRGEMAEASTIETVTEALDRLVEWQNLVATPDTGRVTQVSDFYRRRRLFQLSRAGEAAERALLAYDEHLGRRGALQTVALDDIAVLLKQVDRLLATDEFDLGTLQASLTSLTQRFTELAENASAFMGSLQRTIELTDADEAAFLAYKSRLIDYLDTFIQDLTVRGPQIAAIILAIDARKLDGAIDSLAEREAAAAAPDPDDPEARTERDRVKAFWTTRWAGLHAWFVVEDGGESQSRLLRKSALAAIPALLDAVRAVQARRSGRSDRSTDYLTLAVWFATAEDDSERHALARSAFGLYAPRHLTADAETWQSWNDDSTLVGAPWADAPPLAISPQLRRTGSYERQGRPNRVIDRSAERAMLALKLREQSEQIVAARRRLATDGVVELEAIAGLDSASFSLFLALLGDALVRKRPGERQVRTASSDGTMRIELTELNDGRTVALRTEQGTLRGPNHLVRIEDLTADNGDAAAAGAAFGEEQGAA